MQIIYLTLAVLGLVLPYSQLVPFVLDNGVDFSLFWSQLFTNRISEGFAFDLLISSLVFWLFLFTEGKKTNLKFLWIYVVLNLTVGLSFALPLFLWVKNRVVNEVNYSNRSSEI